MPPEPAFDSSTIKDQGEKGGDGVGGGVTGSRLSRVSWEFPWQIKLLGEEPISQEISNYIQVTYGSRDRLKRTTRDNDWGNFMA